jgi:hypothetical protein
MRLARITLLVTLLGCLVATPVWAQATSGSMSGTITDPNGAMVPGAKVAAVHVPTGRAFSTTASESGLYVFPNLPPGPYEVTVEQPGFKKMVRTGLEIQIGTRQDLNVTLEVGDLQQTVEVKTEVPLLEMTSAERGQNLSPQVLASLPIYSSGLRSAEAFISYMPGVNSNSETSINGSNGRAKEVFIDGASLTIPESGGVNFYFPGFEAYQEMKLVTSSFNAEYGRLGGGLELFSTKSGTNTVHASAFWNLRRDIFDAAGWGSNAVVGRKAGYRAKARYNEEGGTAGGPIWIPKLYDGRNKSFFFFTYAKDVRPVTPVITSGETVPTTLMKQGNFSELAYPIYDPATTVTTNGVTSRTAFASNQIPKSRWSTISTNMLAVIPDPNSGGGLTSNYTLNGASSHDDTLWTLKFDHAFTTNHRVAFFMTHRNYLDTAPYGFSGALSSGLKSGQYPEDYRVNYDFVITPTMLLHTTYGNSQTIQLWNNPEQNGWGTKFGFPGLSGKADATPYISFSTDNLTSYGMNQGKVNGGGQFNYTYQFAQQLSWVRGKHELKFGWDIRRLQTVGDDWAGTNGSYVFSRYQTADPTAKNTTGNAFASFLLGAPNSASQVTLPVVIGQTRYGYHAGFFQDNWRITPRLTFNYGIRYEVPIGWHSQNGLYSNLDITKPNYGAGGLPGALVYAGSGAGRAGVKRFYPTDYSDFGPRLGFAYRIADKTTVRGGFGIFYQTLGNGGCGCTDGIGGAPKSASSDGLNPALYWENGITASSTSGKVTQFDPTADNFYDGGISRQGPNYGKAPRIYNWSVTLQHEYKQYLIELAYVGNRGHGLNSSVFMNELNTRYLSLGSLLGKSITDAAVVAAGYSQPFSGFATGWGGSATLAQALRPYPQYGVLYDANTGDGRTWYDSLQTKVERRFGGLQLMGAYTWSKTLSLMTYRQIFTQGSQVQAQDSLNLPDAKGLSYFDIPHFLNILTSYQLPFGRGKKFFSTSNRLTNLVVGGWAISGVQQYRSGTLLQIKTDGNPLGSGVLFAPVTKANFTGKAIRTGQSATSMDPNNANSRWFNYGTNAPFSAAPAYTMGSTAMYDTRFRNPWFRRENVSISKDFAFSERLILRYRADMMNIFNRSDLGNINATVGNANFGRPQSAMEGGRYISMGLKLEF